MKRTKLIAGNWKMFCDVKQTRLLMHELVSRMPAGQGVHVVICPPFTSMQLARGILKGTGIALGAQNVHWEDEGAYTGEIGVKMVASLGCDYVIVGHSERRMMFGETDEKIAKKIRGVITKEMTPIICIGETLAERDKDETMLVVKRQLHDALTGLSPDQVACVAIAYEPVWAIGTGKTATPAQAQEVHHAIRTELSRLAGADVANAIRILYGGSVKPENAKALFSERDIDGGLIGGASLDVDNFLAIIAAAS